MKVIYIRTPFQTVLYLGKIIYIKETLKDNTHYTNKPISGARRKKMKHKFSIIVVITRTTNLIEQKERLN